VTKRMDKRWPTNLSALRDGRVRDSTLLTGHRFFLLGYSFLFVSLSFYIPGMIRAVY